MPTTGQVEIKQLGRQQLKYQRKFLLIYLFIYLLRERKRESMSRGRDRGKGRGRESQADPLLSMELATGLDLMTLRS